MLQEAQIKTQSLKIINQVIKEQASSAQIIAVTKTLSLNAIKSAVYNKIYIIGESRVLEAEKKLKRYKDRKKIELHLIGHLQSNKTKKAVQIFDVIQTADSTKIIKKINKHAENENKKQKIFLQINIGNDKKKFGFTPNKLKETISNFTKLKNILVKGVMTILPQNITKEQRQAYYIQLKTIQETIQKNYFQECGFTSMGMSGDYREAVLAGATHIRIGTYLYGKRTTD